MSRASEGDKIDESQPPLLAKVLVQRLSDPVEEAQRTIARVAEAWKQLDREYAVCAPSGSKRSKCSASMPKSLNLGRIRDVCSPDALMAAQIEGLKEEHRNAYCQKLSVLFDQVPLLKVALEQQTQHDATVSQLSSADIGVIPELESPLELVPAALEPVYTFGVYHARSHALQQKVQVLGKQRLTDLCNVIECLQDHVENPSPSCPFFFVDCCFYEDRAKGERSVTSDIIQWMQSSHPSSSSSSSSSSSPAGAPSPALSSSLPPTALPLVPAATPAKPSRQLPSSYAALAKALLEQMQATPSLPLYSRKRRHAVTASLPTEKPSVNVLSMQELAIEQVPWEAGRKVLYCHQHGCEHWVSLLDVQHPSHVAEAIFSATDGAEGGMPVISTHPASRSSDNRGHSVDFPRQVHCVVPRKRRCEVCEAFAADYIVYRDRLASATSGKHQLANFMCRTCFQMLHYGADGRLLYDDFLVFPFPQFSAC